MNSVARRELLIEPANQYGLLFERFSEAIRKGGPSPTPPEDALNNMVVLDALFRSEQSGNRESIPIP